MDILDIINNQKNFFKTNKTRDINFRLQNLKLLKKVIKDNERELSLNELDNVMAGIPQEMVEKVVEDNLDLYIKRYKYGHNYIINSSIHFN